MAQAPAATSAAAVPAATVPAAAPAPAEPPKLVAQVFGDWIYRCTRAEAPAKPVCEVAQPMLVDQNGQTIAIATLAFSGLSPEPKAHGVVLIAPLGIDLKAGAAVSVDDGRPQSFAYAFCDQAGCRVSEPNGEALLTGFKRGKDGHLRLGLVGGRTLTINFSLSGLSAAMAALDSGQVPVEAPAPVSAPPAPPAQ